MSGRTRKTLPPVDTWTITRCACGQVALRIGSLKLAFSPAEFLELRRLLERATLERRDALAHAQSSPADVVH